MHQRPILSLGVKWNNRTLEWGHIKPTHQQAATQVCCSGRKDLGAEAAALDANGSVGCESGCAAMSIQQWNSRKNVRRGKNNMVYYDNDQLKTIKTYFE